MEIVTVGHIVRFKIGGDDHDDDNGDGNKNKAEEDSNAALADCDHNDVEDSSFECFAGAGDAEGGLIEIPG